MIIFVSKFAFSFRLNNLYVVLRTLLPVSNFHSTFCKPYLFLFLQVGPFIHCLFSLNTPKCRHNLTRKSILLPQITFCNISLVSLAISTWCIPDPEATVVLHITFSLGVGQLLVMLIRGCALFTRVNFSGFFLIDTVVSRQNQATQSTFNLIDYLLCFGEFESFR